MKFRKRCITIEAEQFFPISWPRIRGVRRREVYDDHGEVMKVIFSVTTIYNRQSVDLEPGDWIIPEPDGEHFYLCKPDIFNKTYEQVEEE